MELRLSRLQEELQEGVRELLGRESPIGRSRSTAKSEKGYSPELWAKLANEGYLGTAFEQRFGGGGQSFLEACLVLEELGRFRVPSPYLTTVAICGTAIDRFGSEDQRAEHLPEIISGERIFAYADAEPGGSWGMPPTELRAEKIDGGFLLNGRKTYVPYAHLADLLLVVARATASGGEAPRRDRDDSAEEAHPILLIVDQRSRGVSTTPLVTVDNDHYRTVEFDEVSVAGEALLAGDPAAPPTDLIDQFGAAARCAEMVGGADRVLEMSLEFAKKREQFGHRIGSFQAVQHHCADMAVDAVSSRLVTSEAVWRLSRRLDARREVSVAKAWVSDAYLRICSSAHQIHGAIGYTMGHTMQLFYRHASSAALQFGDADYHRELLARELGM